MSSGFCLAMSQTRTLWWYWVPEPPQLIFVIFNNVMHIRQTSMHGTLTTNLPTYMYGQPLTLLTCLNLWYFWHLSHNVNHLLRNLTYMNCITNDNYCGMALSMSVLRQLLARKKWLTFDNCILHSSATYCPKTWISVILYNYLEICNMGTATYPKNEIFRFARNECCQKSWEPEDDTWRLQWLFKESDCLITGHMKNRIILSQGDTLGYM